MFRKILFAEEVTLLLVGVAALLLPLSVLATFLLLWPLLRVFSVHVYELGIRGHDMVGRRVEVAWSQISGCESQWLFGLSYLRVPTSDPRRTLWLPLFLLDRSAFDRIVAQRAGASHPLTRALRSSDAKNGE